jgi:hypothetical protein
MNEFRRMDKLSQRPPQFVSTIGKTVTPPPPPPPPQNKTHKHGYAFSNPRPGDSERPRSPLHYTRLPFVKTSLSSIGQ